MSVPFTPILVNLYVKISQILTGGYHAWATLLNQQYCPSLFEQYCSCLFQQYCSSFFQQYYSAMIILFSNDEERLFVVVGTGKICIDGTSMLTIVDIPVSSYYSIDDWTMLQQHCYYGQHNMVLPCKCAGGDLFPKGNYKSHV